MGRGSQELLLGRSGWRSSNESTKSTRQRPVNNEKFLHPVLPIREIYTKRTHSEAFARLALILDAPTLTQNALTRHLHLATGEHVFARSGSSQRAYVIVERRVDSKGRATNHKKGAFLDLDDALAELNSLIQSHIDNGFHPAEDFTPFERSDFMRAFRAYPR